MAARYVAIELNEVKELLKEEKGWKEVDVANVHEHVFDWAVPERDGVVVRVYSSISKDFGCRKVGADAIRICAVDVKRNRGLVKSLRVYRVPNWQERVKSRVWKVIKIARERSMRNTAPNVRQKPAPELYEGKKEEKVKCQDCGGTGRYVWGTIINGVPQHSGKCYRCNGKGFQTAEDRKRNEYYDNRVRRVEIA